MGRVKDLHIQEMNKAAEMQEELIGYDAGLKNTRRTMTTDKAAEKAAEEIMMLDGKILITKGFVEKITPVSSKFGGFNYRVTVGGSNFYFNCKVEDGVYKLLEVGKPCAFLAKKKGAYSVITQVFYCA
jgi:hypothetical protein